MPESPEDMRVMRWRMQESPEDMRWRTPENMRMEVMLVGMESLENMEAKMDVESSKCMIECWEKEVGIDVHLYLSF